MTLFAQESTGSKDVLEPTTVGHRWHCYFKVLPHWLLLLGLSCRLVMSCWILPPVEVSVNVVNMSVNVGARGTLSSFSRDLSSI